MQKSRYDIVLIELVLGGESEDIDPAKLAVRRFEDERLDCINCFRLCRFLRLFLLCLRIICKGRRLLVKCYMAW